MLINAGFKNSPLITSSLLEITGLLTASISLLLITSLFTTLAKLPKESIYIYIASLIFILMITKLAINSSPKKHTKTLKNKEVILIYTNYLLFFILSGSILYFIANTLDSSVNIEITKAICIFSISWLAGLITPGAPSGIGVRESVMLFFLEYDTSASNAAIITVFSRLVTVAGDVLFYMSTKKTLCFKKN